MLNICNNHNRTIWATIMYSKPNCSDGGNWKKVGWWRIEPGQCKNVFGGSLRSVNRYFCYYAESSDGLIWNGPYTRLVPPQAFDWCEWTGNTSSRNVGYRLLDINSYDNFTLTLHK